MPFTTYKSRAMSTSTSPSVSIRSCSTTSSYSFLLLALLLLQAICSAQTSGNFYRENRDTPSKSLPKDCYKSQRLRSYSTDDTEYSYRLTVDLPKSVSRKNLNVDIDYDTGIIEILGWWMEQKVRGERPKKVCVYQEFVVDIQWLEQTSTDLSLYDLVMELQGQQLSLTLPKPSFTHDYEEEKNDNGGRESNVVDEKEDTTTYVVARNLWKMVRGLARLNSSLHNSTFFDDETDVFWNDLSRRKGDNQSAMAYVRSRQDALERFLRFSLGATDEESYWLKKM